MTFEPGLIEKLKQRFPDLANFGSIVTETEADVLRGGVINPSALLHSKVARAAKKSASPDQSDRAETIGPPGGFLEDGSWDRGSPGRDALTRFVWQLCRTRREERDLAPQEYAGIIGRSAYAEAFSPDFREWLAATSDPAFWTTSGCRRSSDVAVVHAGWGDARATR